MVAARPILRVGLTGGIASGKTTVAGFFEELGSFVIDADRIVHGLIDRGGSAHSEVVLRFGDRVLDGKGGIDRAALGRIVFADPEARMALNAIVHPLVMTEAERRLSGYLSTGHAPVAVFEAALLVETGAYLNFDRLVVVRCTRDTQLRRLLARSGLDPEEALARIDSQGSTEDKAEVADYVIDTDGTLRDTETQTAEVYAALVRDFEEKFGAPGQR